MIKKIAALFLGVMLFIPTMIGMAASNSKISIDMYYLVVSPADNGATNMMSMVNYTNSSSKAYTGDGTSEGVLKVTLPESATNLNFLDKKITIKQTNTGFITKKPIPANQTQVLPYNYKMPKGKQIQLKFDYPVQILQVLVPEGMGSVTFKGVDSTNQGTFNFEGQNYVGYSVEGIQSNQSFIMVYNKDKQPKSTGSQTQTNSASKKTSSVTRSAPAFHNPGHIRMWEESPLHNFNPHIFLIVLIAMIISGIAYWIYFRRKARLEEERVGADKEEKAFQLLMAKQKAILDKIIELEEAHDAGKIPDEDFHKKLEAYKEHLVQVKLGLQKFID